MRYQQFKIERRRNLSYEEFSQEYLFPLKPVIVTDVLREWPAMERWTLDFFKSEFGMLKFFNYGAEFEPVQHEYTLAHLIDRVRESTEANPAPYFRNKVLTDISSRLLEDIQPLPEYLYPNWIGEHYLVNPVRKILNRGAAIELFIGGTGSAFPVLHYDGCGSHAFLMQIYGEKEYIFYPPEQEECLYPAPTKLNTSLIDMSNPDFEKFPLFRNAVPTKFILKPGEMLFVPSHWWHTARMLTPCITLSANVLNQSNWHELVKYVALKPRHPIVSFASHTYLTGAGAWRVWRDRIKTVIGTGWGSPPPSDIQGNSAYSTASKTSGYPKGPKDSLAA